MGNVKALLKMVVKNPKVTPVNMMLGFFPFFAKYIELLGCECRVGRQLGLPGAK